MKYSWLALIALFALGACSSNGGGPDGDGSVDGGDSGIDPNCVPKTCTGLAADSRVACGVNSDGCGGTVTCTDPGGESPCRGFMICAADSDGVNRCQHPGQSACTPLTPNEACAGVQCGHVSDGCHGTIDCGGCDGGLHCTLGTCGASPCTPTPENAACDGLCGTVSDGCSGTYECHDGNGGETCTGYEFCGWGGVPNECGTPPCTPTTCEEIGFTCGLAPDGCGGVLNCWPNPANPQCASPNERCIGGINEPARCVAGSGTGCTGPLCDHLPDCSSQPQETRLTGRVTTPDGELGVPNAIVYIPRDPTATLPAIQTGPTCERCEDENLGPLLVGAVTNFNGEFTLEGRIPVGVPFRIVVKAGKWRRVSEVTLSQGQACSTVNLAGAEALRLPANQNDGLAGTHFPLIAISTGQIDAMECVLYKMGFDRSEFTVRGRGDGRIHMYRRNGGRMGTDTGTCARTNNRGTNCNPQACQANPGACVACSDNGSSNCAWTPTQDFTIAAANLYDGTAGNGEFSDYDMVLWDCEGPGYTDYSRSSGGNNYTQQRARLMSYLQSGGRFFASHLAYTWLNASDTLSANVSWDREITLPLPPSGTGRLSFSRTHGNTSRLQTFARWLHAHGAGTITMTDGVPTAGTMEIRDPRDHAEEILTNGIDEWMYREVPGSTTSIQQFSTNIPVGDANACGRLTYTAFHVVGEGTDFDTSRQYFPWYCAGTTLSAQEKTLAYMIFDLAACISDGDPPNPPDCTPLTPQEACVGGLCGTQSDGCGGIIDCTCPGDEDCIGGFCGGTCPAATCEELGAECGNPPDGCGSLLDCGGCPVNTACGVAVPFKCGSIG